MSCGAPTCAFFGEQCESCARRRRYGVIVVSITWEALLSKLFILTGGELDALDALAEIMEDRKRLFRAHNRELSDEIRGAQRDAREAYADGRHDGAGSERW